MGWDDWATFMAIWIAASLPLGPNALNCISVSAAHGLRAALWSVLGVTLAATLHMTLAVTGLAAFMRANPLVFEVIRWLGVAYLLWMGIGLLRARGTLRLEAAAPRVTRRGLVARAILISLGNPKAIFAWLAVFSQFILPAAPLAPQLAILAPSALAVTLGVYSGYALLGQGVSRVMAGRRRRWFDRIAGITYIGFAAGLASGDLRRA